MASIADIYARRVHEQLKPFYANWEPGRPVMLGDYGILQRRVFHHLGNIGDLGLTFDVRPHFTTNSKTFSSDRGTEIRLHAKGTTYTNAALEIVFKHAEAVFFNAAGCGHSMVADKSALGAAILTRLKAGEWNRSWAVVTDSVSAGATTIVVSGGNASVQVLEAGNEQRLVDLADPTLTLAITSQTNVAFQLVAKQGLVPLIGLCRLQPAFLTNSSRPQSLVLARGSADDYFLDDQEDVALASDIPPEELYFGQLR